MIPMIVYLPVTAGIFSFMQAELLGQPVAYAAGLSCKALLFLLMLIGRKYIETLRKTWI